MDGILSVEDIKALYPNLLTESGELKLSDLCIALVSEVADLQDQMKEKDFQILRITERLDELEGRI